MGKEGSFLSSWVKSVSGVIPHPYTRNALGRAAPAPRETRSRPEPRPRLVPACPKVCTGHVRYGYKSPAARRRDARTRLVKRNRSTPGSQIDGQTWARGEKGGA